MWSESRVVATRDYVRLVTTAALPGVKVRNCFLIGAIKSRTQECRKNESIPEYASERKMGKERSVISKRPSNPRDRWMDGRTDRQTDVSLPLSFPEGGGGGGCVWRNEGKSVSTWEGY